VAVVGICADLSLQAGALTSAKPDEVGLTAERLGRIHEAVSTG
jgi:hypothetical protein